ncbi:MAG: signal peptidase I [Candidatus Dormibacteraeota bacterium]|uniref:Signal peptidase I n=1 Tax=Candidatus Dormiibacter inghamiae TaxID=3127013 RepID=A0A934ND76_9BACT|nr:signal peptidase I [Candidatus Dormibacteraeota bacterium]MBJ7605717.1 signal peptidase I [Candidatus Dormibacteraeota bacterium]
MKFKSRSLLTELLQVGLLALGLYLVIHFVVQPVHVLGSSMYPTLKDQDYVIAVTVGYRFQPPQRGDIVIMRDPYDRSKDFIKRVVGLPGDRFLMKAGRVYINGQAVNEAYVNQEPETQFPDYPVPPDRDQQGRQLGPDEFFVLGDNRNRSNDSRYFGPVKRDQIEGRAWLRVLPLTGFGPVDGTKPTFSQTDTLPQAA